MTFLYLVPTGMNDPDHPSWGSWAGRYGRNENYPNFNYYWANAPDTWRGTTHRENSLKRWAEHLQNDFRSRLDWCVKDFAHANHPPVPRIRGELTRTVSAGQAIELDAGESSDPDNDKLNFEWVPYPECTNYSGVLPELRNSQTSKATLVAPRLDAKQSLHVILIVTDSGAPPLTRYQRLFINFTP